MSSVEELSDLLASTKPPKQLLHATLHAPPYMVDPVVKLTGSFHLPPYNAEEQAAIDRDARRFAGAMKAPLIFTSSTESINVLKLFKVILSRVFAIRCTLPQVEGVGEPLLIF